MSASLTISTRGVGRRQRLLDDWSIPFPPNLDPGGGNLTLRDLIIRTVQENVQAFRQRQQERRFVQVLTARQIEQAAARGKVDMGGSDLEQKVDEEQAVAAALQAFEDGLYLVIVDDQEQRELDRQVFLKPESRITFLRLVMLAGA